VLVGAVESPGLLAEAYLRRARTFVRLHDGAAAGADLARAAEARARFPDAALSERIGADIDSVWTEVLAPSDCVGAIAHGDRALAYFERVEATIRRAALLTVTARCRQSLGNDAAASADLSTAVALFEARRRRIRSAADRVTAFELERATFRDLIAMEVGHRHDEAAGLQTAERARAGVLFEAWPAPPVTPDVHSRLGADVAVFYYECLPDRVLIWVLTRERQTLLTRPIGEAALRRMVSRVRRSVDRGADLAVLRVSSEDLFEALVAPALAAADRDGVRRSAVVIVPDGPLFAVPFGSLPDSTGAPLLATHTVAIAPSLHTFLAASERLVQFAPRDVLAIGDGHDPVATGLPVLPRADEEVAAIGRLYDVRTVLAGASATKSRLLNGAATVVHFAGHSILNERYPMLSRMLFAPDPRAGDSGLVFSSEIASLRFERTGLVVLATCDGAAGQPVEGEGAISVARAFFAAGVPAVVASLWPVDDDLQTLMTTLHRQLRLNGDPARALRDAQRALLRERGPRTPVRVWGGFIMLGGLTRAHQEAEHG